MEIRSVNGRFLECRCSVPREMMLLELEIRDAVKRVLKRGNVTVVVSYSTRPREAGKLIDESGTRRVLEQLQQVAKKAKISTDATLDTLLRIATLTENAAPGIELEAINRPLRTALKEALQGVMELRAKEGEALAKDMRKRAARIRGEMKKISALAPEVVTRYVERIRRQLDQLAEQSGTAFDPVKVVTETGVFAERIDITEEVTRMDSHLEQFETALETGGVIGKRLDFIVQELHREINTAGNKANSAEISRHIVTVKEELEKLREQAQNIE